jgi:hypothetical protein
MSKPEEHHGYLSTKILEVSYLPVMVDQFELLPELHAAHISGLKCLRLLPASGEINEAAQRQY